jgi:hypothetical protein
LQCDSGSVILVRWWESVALREQISEAWLVFELHTVMIAAIEGRRIRVCSLEAVDGTPILNIKPILSADIDRR